MSFYDGYAYHSASAVTVLISASEQPTLNRMIEAPSDAPDAWFANAFLLAVGEDPLRDEDADGFRLPQPYAPARWGAYPDEAGSPPSRTFNLPGVPHVLEVRRLQTRTPAAGESKVSVIEEDDSAPDPLTLATDRMNTGPATAHSSWQTSAAPLSVREVNTELTDQYGVVQPHVDPSLILDLGYGISSDCLLVQLLRVLPPVRRLALRAHIREAGLLDRASFTEADAAALFAGLRVLIERIGPDGVEQSDDGWLSDDVLHDVERTLGWTSQLRVRFASARGSDEHPGASLLASARSLRLVRRFKGRVVLTNRAKELHTLPTRYVGLLVDHAVGSSRRSGYFRSADGDEPRAIVALTLLSIADGSAASRRDVAEIVARGVAVLDRRAHPYRHYESDAYWLGDFGDDALFSDSTVEDTIARTLDRIMPTGCADSFEELTPAMRRLAHTALLF
ncbi:MAG: hypothetical protein ACTHZW_01520 [Microbacteriaceae bacterium]